MELYLVAVTLEPTKKAKDEESAIAQVIVPPTPVLASNEAEASSRAYRLIPQEHEDKGNRLSVKILSFRTAGR